MEEVYKENFLLLEPSLGKKNFVLFSNQWFPNSTIKELVKSADTQVSPHKLNPEICRFDIGPGIYIFTNIQIILRHRI